MWLSSASPRGTRPFHCLPLPHSGAWILAPSEKKTLPEDVYCLQLRRYSLDRGTNSPVMIMWQTASTFALGNALSGVLLWFKGKHKILGGNHYYMITIYIYIYIYIVTSCQCYATDTLVSRNTVTNSTVVTAATVMQGRSVSSVTNPEECISEGLRLVTSTRYVQRLP
jgi:hypothetical protein